MKVSTLRTPTVFGLTLAACLVLGACATNRMHDSLSPEAAISTSFYQTKTPYQPRQDPETYEKAPPGFAPVFTELVARHGSRGLTSPKYDLALFNMWLEAKKENALTALGQSLGADLERVTRGNALLGYGVAGISKPGYGNLTQMGIAEHTGLAERMVRRLPTLFSRASAEGSNKSRSIVVINSGEARARESGEFFTASLIGSAPAFGNAGLKPPAPGPYPVAKPVVQPVGSNRFLGYFQALKPATDEVTDPKDPLYPAYQAGKRYQDYIKSAAFVAAQDSVKNNPSSRKAAREALSALFAPAFLDKLDSGAVRFANTGGGKFTSDDGKLTITVSGDGKSVIKNSVEAAGMLYELYINTPSMKTEIPVDFNRYIQPDVARQLEQITDGQNFFLQGPGTVESKGVSVEIARHLLDDFFHEVDRIAKGDRSRAATLRFAHAETIIPFVAILGIKGYDVPLPVSVPYSHSSSTWRGKEVAPMAANIQWDVLANNENRLVVRMLHNEKETDFKPQCDTARLSPASKYYDYAGLRHCYGRS